MIKSIPLSKLVPSDRNVRRSSDEAADVQLKADIAARGLLQNLIVTPVKKPRGSFAVEAGGRRLAALKALASEGRIAADHEVPCLVIGAGVGEAREASLAENFQRLSMNPADECLAFGQLVEDGADPESIARRFGLPVRFVEGRLRLAALAPRVFEALAAGEISLEIAKAYGVTADRERQAWVFGELNGSYCANNADSIRRMMTQATASGSDRRALFVGREKYLAAGGRIECDLFADAAGERWLDVPLLETLAAEALAPIAAAKAEELGIAWVRPTLEPWVGYELTAGMTRVVPEHEPLSPETAARIEEAEREIDGLVAALEDEDGPEDIRAEAEARIALLDSEIEALRDTPLVLDPNIRPSLGTFLLLDPEGVPVLDRAFYTESPEDGRSRIAADGEDSPPAGAEPAGPKQKPLPRGLVDELAIQRRDILAAHVAADGDLAFDLAAFLMADRDMRYSSAKSGSSLSALAPTDPVAGFKTPEARATAALAQASDALDRSWTGGSSRAERFDAFRRLSREARSAWLAHALARSLEASAGGSAERSCAFHDHLGALLGIEVHDWWRPTAMNFFDRVPKAVIARALEEVGGSAFASHYAGLRKAELAQSAERVFAGELIADPDVKARALAWVPEPMRFAAPEVDPDGEEEPAPWEDAVRQDSEELEPIEGARPAENEGSADTGLVDEEAPAPLDAVA